MSTRAGKLTARQTVNIPYCCRCFSEEVVQILTTFQTVLAPLGLQASAGKQRVLISRPQPNRLIPGQDSACKKSTQVCPALALSRSDKVRKDSYTRLVCPIPATRGLSPQCVSGSLAVGTLELGPACEPCVTISQSPCECSAWS